LLQSSPNRTFKFTSRYAAAVRSIASQLQLPLLDVWELFTEQQGWQKLLRDDGLHLNLDGQKAVYEALMKVIEQDVPSIRCVPVCSYTWLSGWAS
jgi:lysophospholipase L1-like esterase